MQSLLPTEPPMMRRSAHVPPRSTNWWLRQTSWGWNLPGGAPLWLREQARKSRLASWILLGLFIGMLVLTPLAIGDMRSQFILGLWIVGLVGATALNRQGWVTAAGVVLVALLSGGILLANLASPIGLTMGELPNFDAYVVSVVLAATLLPRLMTFLVAAVNTLLIVANYLFQPHNANITQDAALYSSETVQTLSLLVRPIALQLVLAVVAYLWVRGAEEAIRRADLAEEVVILQRREQTRTFALQEGVRYLQQALSQWVTGDVRHRIPAMPDPVLEQVREDLNLFIDRFGPDRQASFALYRLQEEARRLTMALEDWLSGRPVVWPAPSGTALDRAMELLRVSRSRPPSSSRTSLGPTSGGLRSPDAQAPYAPPMPPPPGLFEEQPRRRMTDAPGDYPPDPPGRMWPS
jgi:hypothetical protein